MTQIDRQMITLNKIVDTEETRQYSAISGSAKGIATYDKVTEIFSYNGDDMGKFSDFIKDTLEKSVKIGKVLPDKIVHGFG